MLSRNIHCNPTLSLCASQTAERQKWQKQFREDPFAQRTLMQKSPDRPHGLARAQRSKATGQNVYETTIKYAKKVPLLSPGATQQGVGSVSPSGLVCTSRCTCLRMRLECYLKMCQVLNFQHGTSVFWISDREEIAVGKEADTALVKGDIVSVLSDARHLCLPVEGVWRGGVPATVYEQGLPDLRYGALAP
jgi:hypothetical protein